LRVLIGLCGIGLGHSTRQLQIARRLVARGHEVRLLTFGTGWEFFQKTEFVDRCLPIFVPWVDCNDRGVQWASTIRRNSDGLWEGLARNRRTRASLRNVNFHPDVCVADYDPIVARIARASAIPLVTIDHQSTYLGYKLPDIGRLSRIEEASRLRLFLPQAAKRLAISFFQVDEPIDPRYAVDLLPPIIRPDVEQLLASPPERDERLIVAYLSAYPAINSFVNLRALANQLATFGEWRFRIYTAECPQPIQIGFNIEVRPTLRGEFTEDLGRAAGLISTAGFSLLSEAMRLNLPVLAIPLATYDQHFCARIISDNGLGLSASPEHVLNVKVLESFLSGIDEMRSEISNSPALLHAASKDTLARICEVIETAR
jgi:uncharacterized protein (TIGR00661 family)